MHINFPWKFHQNVFTLTITFIVLNVSTEFVLIYRRTVYVRDINKRFLSAAKGNCYLTIKNFSALFSLL